jgi:hypothetical protein
MGKTYEYHTILIYLQSYAVNCLVVASSGGVTFLIDESRQIIQLWQSLWK